MIAYTDKRASAAPIVARRPDAMYRHRLETPPAWQTTLDRNFPRNATTSWLYCRWEPGDVWEPVQRWFLWHMRPLHLIANRVELLAELRGPHPRSTGHYCAVGACLCKYKANRWIDGATALIDRGTWEVFHETGCYGTRWWVIQGDTGGHRYRLDAVESRVAKVMTGARDTPIPGELPYADFDGRVLGKVLEADRLRLWKGYLDFTRRNHDQMDAEMRELEIEANKRVWAWLDGQVETAVDKIGQAGRKTLADASFRRNDVGDRHMDYEAIERDFIESPVVAA